MAVAESLDSAKVAIYLKRLELSLKVFGPVFLGLFTAMTSFGLGILVLVEYEFPYREWFTEPLPVIGVLAVVLGLFNGIGYQLVTRVYQARLGRQAETAGLIEKLAMSPDWPEELKGHRKHLFGWWWKGTSPNDIRRRLERLALNLDWYLGYGRYEHIFVWIYAIGLALVLLAGVGKVFARAAVQHGYIQSFEFLTAFNPGMSNQSGNVNIAVLLISWISLAAVNDFMTKKGIAAGIVKRLIQSRIG